MESSRKAKPPSEVSIRTAKNGGHIVRHSFDNFGAGESYRPSEEHAFADHKAMMTHVHKHTKGGHAPANTERTPTGVSHGPRAAAPTSKTRGGGVD